MNNANKPYRTKKTAQQVCKNREFGMRDGQPRETFDSGAVREIRSGKGRYDLVSEIAIFRLARVYEKGSTKYTPRNWEKGMPFHLFVDSAKRHIAQYILGDTAEDHLAQAAWNLCALMHLETTHPEFNDMPACEIKTEMLAKYPELASIFQLPVPVIPMPSGKKLPKK